MTHREALIRVNLGAALLGGTPLFVKLLVLPADAIVGLRSVIAAVALFALVCVARTQWRVHSRQDAGWLLLAGALMGAHWVTYFWAIKLATVALAVVCIYTFPVITVLLEAAVYRRRPDSAQLLAGCIMVCGVALVVPWSAGGGSALLAGAALAIVSAVLYAARNVTYRNRLRIYPSTAMMAWQVAIVALLVLPWSGLGAAPASELLAGRTPWLLLILGVCFTALPHTLVISSMQKLTAAQYGLVACLQPVWAVVYAWLVLGEVPPARGLIGGMLIIGAAAWVAVVAERAEKRVRSTCEAAEL